MVLLITVNFSCLPPSSFFFFFLFFLFIYSFSPLSPLPTFAQCPEDLVQRLFVLIKYIYSDVLEAPAAGAAGAGEGPTSMLVAECMRKMSAAMFEVNRGPPTKDTASLVRTTERCLALIKEIVIRADCSYMFAREYVPCGKKEQIEFRLFCGMVF